MRKNLFVTLLILLSLTAKAEISLNQQEQLAEKIAVASFGEGNYANTITKIRIMRSLDNVKGICGEDSITEVAKLSVAVQISLAKDDFFVTPLEVIEAIGTLKRQAPDDIDCMTVATNYASTVVVAPTPAEALASVNSLYKILKQKTK